LEVPHAAAPRVGKLVVISSSEDKSTKETNAEMSGPEIVSSGLLLALRKSPAVLSLFLSLANYTSGSFAWAPAWASPVLRY
jgi:hypothetical protein